MKYLKYFKTDADYQNYFNSVDFVTPNVSYVKDTNIVHYKPKKRATSTTSAIFATYSATDDNKLAIANTSNVKSLKVNGNNVSFGNTYYFESNGEYKVEIELIDDSIINGAIYDENWNVLSSPMFNDAENEIGSCLTSITIPDSVTSIGEYAFSDCSSLTSITISNSVTSIGRSAFSYCSSLTSITIPDSVTSIGESAFNGCDSLPVENNLRYADTYLVGAVDKSLSTYTIKEGTKWIGEGAFFGCSSLTSITIPDSVTSIGERAFEYCPSLTSITIPVSVTSIGGNAFTNCSKLTSITIPDAVTSIRDNTFNGCSSLTSITIPDSVTSIEAYAFYGCSNLDKIICLATTAPSIMSNTFEKIKSNGLLKIPTGSDYSSWMSSSSYYLGYYNWDIITGDDLIIMTRESNPEVMEVCYNQGWAMSPNEMYAIEAARVTSIGTAFKSLGQGDSDGYGSSNPSFTFSFDEFKYFTGVTSIVNYAFYKSNIVSITIPVSVTSIGDSTFSDCSSLTSITIPDSVTSIERYAFKNCSSLTSITISNSVTSIGVGAFTNCSKLASITIPDSVTSIGDSTFSYCSSLTSITIPNSVTSIGPYEFEYCSSLTSITISNSVTSIGAYAFRGCSNLNEMTCLATTAPRVMNDTFAYINSNGILKYPSGSDYSSWMKTSSYYLGYYNWTTQEIQH